MGDVKIIFSTQNGVKTRFLKERGFSYPRILHAIFAGRKTRAPLFIRRGRKVVDRVEDTVAAFNRGVVHEVEARGVFQVAILVDQALQIVRVFGERADDFSVFASVSQNGNVHRGVAQIRRDLDAGDGHGGKVQAAAGENLVEGFGNLAVEQGV